jgi:hypothetical protein
MNEKILLDISTVIGFISDVVNHPNIIERFPDIDYKYECNKRIRNEFLDEQENPLIPKLIKVLEGKEKLVTKIAKHKIDDIVLTYGSIEEKSNYKKFMKDVIIIEDCPSERYKKLSLVKYPSYFINIFGTADNMDITLLTGYIGGVKIIRKLDYDTQVIAHRSRNLVGTRPNGDEYCAKQC